MYVLENEEKVQTGPVCVSSMKHNATKKLLNVQDAAHNSPVYLFNKLVWDDDFGWHMGAIESTAARHKFRERERERKGDGKNLAHDNKIKKNGWRIRKIIKV